MKCPSQYNIRIIWENCMTNNQFELLIMHGGMMQDGMSSKQAIASIIAMGEPEEDIVWLIRRIGGENSIIWQGKGEKTS